MSEPLLVGIFGTGRNGSTLLTRLLDGMPGAYVHAPEVNFLSAMNDLALLPFVRDEVVKNATNARLRRIDKPVPTRRLLNFYAFHRREIERDLLSEIDDPPAFGRDPEEVLAARQAYRPVEFVPEFLAAYARWLGEPADMLVFKTIETPYVAAYEQLFPSMRFVHILRDPIDTWASQKRSLAGKALPPWYLGLDSFVAMIEKRWVPHMEAVAERRHSPRHFILRYEDLVKAPSEMVVAIANWLERPPPPEPSVQTVLGGRHPRRLLRYSSQQGVETPREATADLKRRYRYDEVVTARERDFIVLRTRRLAREFGYLDRAAEANRHDLMRDWLVRDEWDFRNTAGLKSWVLSILCFVRRRLYVWRALRKLAS